MSNKKKLIMSIVVPLILGTIIGLITNNKDFYATIIKPTIAPPSYIFPIVWSILYILMGIGYYLIWSSNHPNKKEAQIAYWLQLFINLLWSIIFFNLKAFSLAFIWILVLIILVIIMIVKFIRINKLAGLLQIPYLLWIIFAAYLTLMVYLLNS